ncbi:MAG TPA: hypothetical protein VFM46_17900 [Pseudomonadales bacterium]|nr:hypothetical protein [Pseudomonadales bacterium]
MALADDFDVLLDSVKTDYHSGRYQQALASLRKAEENVLEARVALLNASIPDTISGWQPVEVVNEYEEVGLAGSAHKRFIQGEKKVDFIVGPDQPLLTATLNLHAKSGEKVKGIPANVFYDANQKQGQVGLNPSPSLIVVVKGEGVSRQELLDLAANLKMEILSNFK